MNEACDENHPPELSADEAALLQEMPDAGGRRPVAAHASSARPSPAASACSRSTCWRIESSAGALTPAPDAVFAGSRARTSCRSRSR